MSSFINGDHCVMWKLVVLLYHWNKNIEHYGHDTKPEADERDMTTYNFTENVLLQIACRYLSAICCAHIDIKLHTNIREREKI